MTEVLRGIQQCLSYIDDVLTHTRSHKDQLMTLEKVFKALRENNLKINPEKCIFGATTMEYLGFQLMKEGIRPGQSKTRAVAACPPPNTVRRIRQFVGLASFFRDHIPNFAKMSAHLTALTKKDSEWKGGPLPLSLIHI